MPISGFPSQINTVGQSGSITALQVGGIEISQQNPVPVTGSVAINFPAQIDVSGSVLTASGSVTGLLVGGVPVSDANPVPVQLEGGSVSLDVTASLAAGTSVTASLAAGSSVTASLAPGSSVTLNSGSITGLLVGGVAVSDSNPVPEVLQSGSVTGLLVGGASVSDANPVPVSLQNTSVSIDVTASVAVLPIVTTGTGSVTSLYGVEVTGSALEVTLLPSNTPNITTVPYNSGTLQLLAQDNRLAFSIYNDTLIPVNVALGPNASSSLFSFVVQPNFYYESPIPSFQGAVSAWFQNQATASNAPGLLVTELFQ